MEGVQFIIAIAALCNIDTGDIHLKYIENSQLDCQKYYAECVDKHESRSYPRMLLDCIKNKPKVK